MLRKWRRNSLFCYVGILLGAFLCAVGLNGFLLPGRIAAGGITGIATMFYYLFGWSVGFVVLCLNIPLFLLGYRRLGKQFGMRSIFGLMVYSVLSDALPIIDLADDPLLSAVYGGILMGVGLGMALFFGGSTGGVDIAAKLISDKYTRLGIGTILLIMDGIVIILSGLIFSLRSALFALLSAFITSKCISFLVEGPMQARAFLLVSPRAEILRSRIIRELNRSVTKIPSNGGYTGSPVMLLLCIVEGNREVMQLNQLVKDVDENAFMISWHAKEVYGRGFTVFDGEKQKVEILQVKEYNGMSKKGGTQDYDPDQECEDPDHGK